MFFGSVLRRERLSEQVASSILSAIIERNLRPGDPLPSQRELGEQYGVSRTVIREAVGSLEARGVLEVRAGSGLRLVSVDASSVAESLRFFVRTSDVLDYSKVDEVRAMIETHVAELAAERASESDVSSIRYWADKQETCGDDLEAAAQCDLEFHRAIARTTGNELYLVLLDSSEAPCSTSRERSCPVVFPDGARTPTRRRLHRAERRSRGAPSYAAASRQGPA